MLIDGNEEPWRCRSVPSSMPSKYHTSMFRPSTDIRVSSCEFVRDSECHEQWEKTNRKKSTQSFVYTDVELTHDQLKAAMVYQHSRDYSANSV